MNTVYRAGELALRLTGEARKDFDDLTPPLHWLRYVYAAGGSVCESLAGVNATWIAGLEQGSELYLATSVRFLATPVHWVEGPRLSELTPTPELYRA